MRGSLLAGTSDVITGFPRRMIRLRVRIALLLCVPFISARGQVADTLRGRVTTDSGVPIPGAEIIVTRAPDRAFKTTTTDKDGRYETVFENGTGDYLVHASALGRATARARVQRKAAERILVQDLQLKSSVPQLATVTVSAEKPKPERDRSWSTPEPGEAGKSPDGVTGAVAPADQGNLAAIAATAPGVSVTPGGVSVLGLDPSQNRTTLNGLSFSGADVPRAARVYTRVTSSSYDPSRGWFGGAEIATNLEPGFIFTQTVLKFDADAPPMQVSDKLTRASGQRFTNLVGSLWHAGSTLRDKLDYSFAFEGGHRSATVSSLEGAGDDLLRESGLSRDSAARLFALLGAAGLPMGGASSVIPHNTDYASFIGRLDHADRNPDTHETEKESWGFVGYARVARNSPLGINPLALSTHGGENHQNIAVGQFLWSRYLHNRAYLTSAKSAVSVKLDRTTPFLRVPSGNVLVSSDFADLPGAITSVSFGGNSALNQETRDWTWETTSNTRFYAKSRSTHRIDLNADSRVDGYSSHAAGNSLGAFSYNSLADLAANTPTAFTRTLNLPGSSVREWNAFASLGDYWRESSTFQLLFGARVEGNRFLDRPRYNPAVQQTFGVRTDQSPASFHISPRAGFTWIRVDAGYGFAFNGIGQFNIGPPSYLRGGIGEFRGMLQPALLSQAMLNTGLPGGASYLTCVGPAVPNADWASFISDPTTIPTQCANGSGSPTQFTDASPSVSLFDPSYQPPRSWKGNLSYASSFRWFLYSLDGTYSLNRNQPGRTDLNFAGIPHFTVDGEGRPVFVGTESIVSNSGTLSTVDARKSPAFGRVLLNRSDLRSVSRQATLVLSPANLFTRFYGSLAYTLSSTRALASGFDAPTFASPLLREWSRGDLDARHQFLLQGGVSIKRFSITLFSRIQSGFPFTPIVSSDVNGDGLANDRAFIFDPLRASDPTIGRDLASLASRIPDRVRKCLTNQYGHAAARNSCEGPWTASLNLQINKYVALGGPFGRGGTVSLAISNPLGGLDQLLHGSQHLHGWGLASIPDRRLYTVRGFDSVSHRFLYEVNPRFGSTDPAISVARAPFRLTLSVTMSVGPPAAMQQLQRWVAAGRTRPGPRLTSAELISKYRRNVRDPYDAILEESDSLLLTAEQDTAIKAVEAEYLKGVDSLWTTLGDYLANLPTTFNATEAVRRQEETVDAVWEYSRLDVQRTLGNILSPVQLHLLPWPTGMLYRAKEPLHIRTFAM